MPILHAAPPDFEFTIPVLVAGGGACGLSAALAARDAGAEVTVIERDALPRGSTSMSLGALCAAGTADQRRQGVDDGADQFVADMTAKTRGAVDPVVAKLLGEHSGEALDWLAQAHGVPLRLDTNWPPAFGHSRMRMHVTPGRSGADLMDRLLAACESAGVDILANALLNGIFVHEGRVTGVRIVRPDGSVEDVGCGALVLATCGFGANHEMIREHIPAMAAARYFGWEGNKGDGIRLGMEMGGATGDMDAYQGLGLLADPQAIDVNPRFLIEGGVQVNRHGRRFSDELGDVSGQGARVIAQPGGVAWVIFDERIHQSCFDLPQYVALREAGGLRSAGSAEELAALCGIDADGLRQTLDSIGRTDEFGRIFATPPLAAPLHAIRVTGALFHTQGGLCIDERARVVRTDGQAFSNLFAGGGAARGPSGPGPSGYLPGAGLCAAITLGMIAGRSAATASGS